MQVSGTVYYVSSSEGNDNNDGKSPSAPLKTISKAMSKVGDGNTICLKRGDTWRGEAIEAESNLTITAYGEGPKPVIMGSYENGGGAANASKWIEVKPNIWKYDGSDEWADVGNIVFNDGESYANKIVQLYVKQESWSTYQITDYTNAPAQKYSFKSYTDLKNDLDFFHDKDFKGGSGATGYLYMYSTSNPALRFESIEFAPNIGLIHITTDGVTVDNICFKYTGGHAVGGSAHSSLNTAIEDLTVQNCEFYWIGGSVHQRIQQSVIGTNTTAYDTRYGNAIEIYGGCDGFIARNNYIYQVFDAGITIQLTMSSSDWVSYNQKNIQFVDNVIEYCNYSIEYFLTKIPSSNKSKMENFKIANNYMWNAGYGFCETRMIWGRGFAAHIKSQFTSPCNRATGFVIENNVMVGAKDGFMQIRNSFDQNSMPLFQNNSLYGYYDFDGNAAQGYRLGEVRVKSEDTQEWVSYDTDVEAYLSENMGSQYGEGNEYFFMFNYEDVRNASGSKKILATTDKDPMSYKVGDSVVFTCTLYAGDKIVSCPQFSWTATTDDGKTYSGKASGAEGSVTVTVSATATGAIRLKVLALDENGNMLSCVSQGEGYMQDYIFSVIVNASDITAKKSEPSDFDTYWDTQVAKVKAVAPDVISMVKVTSPTDIQSIDGAEKTAKNHDFYRVKIKTPDECGFAVGYLTIPKNASAESLGITVVFNGYGVGDLSPYISPDNIVLNVCAHSYELGMGDSYYDDLASGSLSGYGFSNNSNRDNVYFRTMIMRDLQAVRFIKAYAGTEGVSIDGSKTSLNIWNGKLRLYGGSQGAFQGIAVAALDEDVTDAFWWIPWMCDIGGSKSEYRPSYTDALRYYDTVSFGKRIRNNVNVTITAGLGDYICPPSGVVALYNEMGGNVTLYLKQGMRHVHHEANLPVTIYEKATFR